MKSNRPIFAEYISNSTFDRGDAVLSVFNTGNVFLIFLESDHNRYKFTNPFATSKYYAKILEGDSKECDFLRKLYNTKHIVTNRVKQGSITCIGSFQPAANASRTRVEYVPEKHHLIVSGMVYKKVPSVGVFHVTADSMFLVFVDSLLGVSDITFSRYMHSYIALPRLANSAVALFNPQRQRVIDGKFEHRFVPELLFGGSNMKRTTHISGGSHHKLHAVSWSDDSCPSIITWNFSPPLESDKHWRCHEYDFLVPCFVHHVTIDPSTEKLGFVMEHSEKVFFCVWDLEGPRVVQHNFEVSDVSSIRSAKWVRSIICSQMVYAVSADSGYFEHHTNEIKKWDNPLYDVSTICCDENGDRFYFNEEGNLEFISCRDFYERADLMPTCALRAAPVPIIHNQMSDMCDNLACMHMFRCAKCRRPLLYPLSAYDPATGTKTCYCSHDCFREHWPSYVAVRQKVDFEIAKNDESIQ